MRTRRQALGQHFLRDKSVIEKILSQVAIAAEKVKPTAIVEVGPGDLALTKGLTGIASRLGCPLFLIERDRRLADIIQMGIKENGIGTPPEIHFFDAAQDEFLSFFATLQSRGLDRVLFASNLPYSASSQILANLCQVATQVLAAVVMVQKELADRMIAPAGGHDRGSFSLLMQSYFQLSQCFDVSPGAFHPPPKVMSSVLTLNPLIPSPIFALKKPFEFQRFCQKIFSQRRKMIRKLVPPEALLSFSKLGISGTERPETLPLEIFVKLYLLSGGL